MNTALICGVSGQDGAWLAKLLLERGYTVFGASRDAQINPFHNLVRLGIRDRVTTVSMTLTDFRSVLQVLRVVKPDEIYNLAGQTSVALSFDQPVETLESIAHGTLNLLEAIRFMDEPIRLYNASSSECFGDTGGEPASEQTPFRPRSPYAVAKATAHWEVANYREAYGLYACSGILFNHESPLRPERFVTRKVVSAAWRIKNGSGEVLRIGNLNIERDWGWAPEYMEVVWRMLQKHDPADYVIATGESHSLREFLEATFGGLDMDWREHVRVDRTLLRPAEILRSAANPSRARKELDWRANHKMPDVVRMMLEAEMESNIKV